MNIDECIDECILMKGTLSFIKIQNMFIIPKVSSFPFPVIFYHVLQIFTTMHQFFNFREVELFSMPSFGVASFTSHVCEIHLQVYTHQYFILFITEWNSVVLIYHNLFIHSPLNGQLDCFQLGAFMNLLLETLV